MMQYSLLDRRPEETCLSILQEKNIGVLTRGSVAQGLLVNKTSTSYLNYTDKEVEIAVHAINHLSGDRRSAAQTALQYVLHHPAVTSAIVGMRNILQLEEAVHAITTPMLTEEEIQRLKQILPANYYEQHR
jgi:aryl-alcohol dehydrogenase-like predicted oxidoreductase